MGASTKKRKHQQFELSKYFKSKTNGSGSIRTVTRPIRHPIKETISDETSIKQKTKQIFKEPIIVNPVKKLVPLIDPLLPNPQPALYAAAQSNLPDVLAVKSDWRGDEGRIGDSWVNVQYKLLFSTPTKIRLRLVRVAAYETNRSCEKLNGLTFASAGRRPAAKALSDCLTAVMRPLCDHPSSQSFMEEFVTDFTVVHHPLCLRVINERISNHYYIYAHQWLADVRQVVENVWQCFPMSSEMAKQAHVLWEHAATLCRTNDKIKHQIPESVLAEHERRQVLQAHLVVLKRASHLPFPAGVTPRDLPKPLLCRLARRSGRVPDEWPDHWKSNATAP